ALDHEARNDSVEDEPVVEVPARELRKRRGRAGRVLDVEREGKRPEVRLHRRRVRPRGVEQGKGHLLAADRTPDRLRNSLLQGLVLGATTGDQDDDRDEDERERDPHYRQRRSSRQSAVTLATYVSVAPVGAPSCVATAVGPRCARQARGRVNGTDQAGGE